MIEVTLTANELNRTVHVISIEEFFAIFACRAEERQRVRAWYGGGMAGVVRVHEYELRAI